MHDLLWMLAFSFALVSYGSMRYFIPTKREQEIRDRKWLIQLLIRRESLPDVTDAANMEALETIYRWTFVENKAKGNAPGRAYSGASDPEVLHEEEGQ